MPAKISMTVLSPAWLTGRQVAAGDDHSLAITPAGEILTWGDDDRGQLGVGGTSRADKPAPVVVQSAGGGNLKDAIMIDGGRDHSMATRTNNELSVCGRNQHGQLGLSSTNDATVATKVSALADVRTFTAGSNHSLAVASDGQLYAWGNNDNGQLGLGTSGGIETTPQEVTGALADVLVPMTAAGFAHSLALTGDGKVYAWGLNNKGQLGLGNTTSNKQPTEVQVSEGGAAVRFEAIAAGLYHSLALTEDGKVYAWGLNVHGQAGAQSGNDRAGNRLTPQLIGGALAGKRVVSISAGEHHSLALTAEGELYGWGRNTLGQLAQDPGTVKLEATKIALPDIVVAMTAGRWHSLAVMPNGDIYAWGQNLQGQVGNDLKGDVIVDEMGQKYPVVFNPRLVQKGTAAAKARTDVFAEDSYFDFWDQDERVRSRPVTFVIYNEGDADLTLEPLTLAGADPGDFEIASQPSSPVKPGQSATFTMVFYPKSDGLKSAIVNFTNNASADNEFTFNVRGRARNVVSPALEVRDPDNKVIADGNACTMSNVLEGASGTFTFKIRNTGDAALVVSSIALDNSADFSLAGVSSPLTIAAGSEQSVQVTLGGRNTGRRTTRVTIASNATPASMSFSLTGTVDAKPVPRPARMVVKIHHAINTIWDETMANGQNTTYSDRWDSPGRFTALSFYIENAGEGDLQLQGASLSDTSNWSLAWDTGTPTGQAPRLPVNIPAGGRYIVFVVCSAGSSQSTSLTLRSNDPTNPSFTVHINLSGAGANPGAGGGTARPGLVVKRHHAYDRVWDENLSNGQNVVNTYRWDAPGSSTALSFYIENTGPGDLQLQGASLSDTSNWVLTWDVGVPSGQRPSFPVTVRPGGRYILFLVRSVGPSASTILTLQTNDPGNPSFAIPVNVADPSGGSTYPPGGGGGQGRLAVTRHHAYDRVWEEPIYPGQTTVHSYPWESPSFTCVSFYIENRGSGNLQLQSITSSDPSFLVKEQHGVPTGPDGRFPTTIPAGGRYILFLVYSPWTQPPGSTTVTVRTDDPGNPMFTFQVTVPSRTSGGYW